MGLYADENFPLRVVEELRRLGHDVLTALEDGKADRLGQAERISEAFAEAVTLNGQLVRVYRPVK